VGRKSLVRIDPGSGMLPRVSTVFQDAHSKSFSTGREMNTAAGM